ncbi:MAG: DUF89 domain-containing protein [Planctomycetota bacterium]
MVAKLANANGMHSAAISAWVNYLVYCLSPQLPPPVYGRMIQRRIEDLTGLQNPYAEIKRRTNDFALDLLPRFRELIIASEEPVRLALRLAAAGNIIDLGAKRELTLEEAADALDTAADTPLQGGDEEEAVARIMTAPEILILADNSGEIVFDMLLAQTVPCPVTVAVRERPIINDATMADVIQVGLEKVARVITTGSDLPGVWFPACPPEFVRLVKNAPLVISKGQGNFEGLSGESFSGYFLLRVKCDAVSRKCGFPVGTNALFPAGRFND